MPESAPSRRIRGPGDGEPPGAAIPVVSPENRLPRWRGFNLSDYLSIASQGDFRIDDLKVIGDWGFDFVRVPLNYRLWADFLSPRGVHEEWLDRIDRVVECGTGEGLHVCLCFHRAPGFTVSREGPEPRNLWRDDDALEEFLFHWGLFARRYAGVPGSSLSFNLVNEPPAVSSVMTRADHNRVISQCVATIREIDPDRLIIVDGLRWGRQPIEELAHLGVGQSCRGYDPLLISHYGIRPDTSQEMRPPSWPGVEYKGIYWDRARLKALYEPWMGLIREGVGVHCGELGVINRTPHRVALAWLADLLSVLQELGIGWAMWDLRGRFGVLDSRREDVRYERTSMGYLDRKLLSLLQES